MPTKRYCNSRFMKKQIANIITGSRILVSLPLIWISLSSVWFFIFYLFCGLTDMIDGTIARKTGSVRPFGARLDTVADFVFLSVCAIRILPLMHIPVWLWVWIILAALIKIWNIAFVFLQKKKLLSIHSVLNKATGLALFLLPLSLPVLETTHSVAAICALATIAGIQETCLIAKGQAVLSSGSR